MSFLHTVARARAYLKDFERVSIRALQRECDIEGDALDDLISELCAIQGIARREEDRLVWIGEAEEEKSAAEPLDAHETLRGDEAQHRQITVLFCDLKGSTELAQTIDAEEYRGLLRAYYDEAKRVIDNYEGHVAQYMGDGLMVFFGYPQAHEDDPERAVRAGLEIIDALMVRNRKLEKRRGVSLSVRIGIHTGPVVVGDLAGHGDDFAIGDTLNCAARVQGEAEPDTVLISESTYKRVGGIFVCEDLGLRELKGVSFPIRLHRPLQPAGVRSRFDAVRGKLTEFVGRGQEIGLLAEKWGEAERGHGQVVFVSGEAGLGKSRLAAMLQDILRNVPHTWLECHASLYTRTIPFHGVIELVNSALGLTPALSAEARRRRLIRTARTLNIKMRSFVPVLDALLGEEPSVTDSQGGLAATHEKRMEKVVEALTAWALALSQVQPVLILIEDLHWQDDESLELLGRLAASVQERPILLLVTARPEFNESSVRAGDWTTIQLEHLDRAQAREFIRAMSRGRELSPEIVEDVIHRADGVPLYLEELARAAFEKEHGGATHAIPDTLQDSLMARLDHIPAPKEVAQTASVIGRQFHYELLAAVCDMDEALLQQSLEQLVESQILVQLGAPPKASYLFRQTLLRDTAYQSMVRGTRERRHGRVAEVMIERMPEMIEQQPETIANHFAEAGNVKKAIDYLKLAGERSRDRNALDDALKHLERALDLLAYIFDPQERRRQELGVRLAMGGVLALLKGHGHPETGEVYVETERLAREIEDDFSRGLGALAMGEHRSAQGLLHVGMDHFAEALKIGRDTSEDLLIIGALQSTGQAQFLLGQIEDADAVLSEAIERYDPNLHDFAKAGFPVDSGQSAYCWGQWVAFERGDVDRAYELSSRSLEISERSTRPVNRCIALCWSAMTAIHCGQGRRAGDLAIQAERLATQMGFSFYQELARVLQALAEGLFQNNLDDIETCFEAITRMVESGHQICIPWMLDRLATIHIKAGHLSAAESRLRMAEEIAGSTCQFFRNAEVARLWGEIYRVQGTHSSDEIEASFQKGLETAREQKARFLEIQAVNSLSKFWITLDRRTEACELLKETLAGMSEEIDTPEMLTARSLIRELSGTPAA